MGYNVTKDEDNGELDELVEMIDLLMENGDGHLTINADETEEGIKVIPEVSRQVWIPRRFAFSKSSVTKSSCKSGSPPVQVIPPFFINSLYDSYSSRRLSAVLRSPLPISQVSGLWQYLHLMGQPCIKITNLIPGPSTVPKLSVE